MSAVREPGGAMYSSYCPVYCAASRSRDDAALFRARRHLRLAAFLLCIAWGGAVAPVRAQALTVFAAASLADVLAELLQRFESGPGIKVVASYAASSTLARQIERGAPADLFVSADQAWMDHLAKAGRIHVGTRTVLARNRLVLIAHANSTDRVDIAPGFALSPLVGDSRLAIGDPLHVPAGRYAKAALVSLGVWDSVARRIAAAENVRAALNYVARGEARLGIVYATDARQSPVRVVGMFPANSHPPIEYPAALTAAPRNPQDAGRLLGYLRSPEAAVIFRRHGFIAAAP